MTDDLHLAIATLRARGYRIIPPRDLRVAGPWQSKSGSRWVRAWEHSSVTAASIRQVSAGCGAPGCACEGHDRAYRWIASLFGTAYRSGRRGMVGSLECAQTAADQALLELLSEARVVRLEQMEAADAWVEPLERLMLPEGDHA